MARKLRLTFSQLFALQAIWLQKPLA